MSSEWSPQFKLTVGIFATVLFLLLLYAARAVLAPVIIGTIIGYIFYPYARFIQYSTAIPHRPATALLYIILLAIIVPIIVLSLPSFIDGVQFITTEVVTFLQEVSNAPPDATFEILGFRFFTQQFVTEVLNALLDVAREIAGNVPNLVASVAQIAVLTVITLLIGFYMTSDGDRFLSGIENAIPEGLRDEIERIITEIDSIWASFFRANLLLAIVVGVLMTGVSAAIGLPRPVLMGVLAGLLEFIPTVGHVVWLIVAVTVAGIEGSTWLPVSNQVFMLITIVVTIAYTQLDTRVLIPAIMGNRERLHPIVVVVGIIVGAALAGVLGIVLAAPTISSLAVIGRYLRAKLFDKEPFPDLAPPALPDQEKEAT